MWSNIPDFYPLNASNSFPPAKLKQAKMSPDIAKYLLGVQSDPPVENQNNGVYKGLWKLLNKRWFVKFTFGV